MCRLPFVLFSRPQTLGLLRREWWLSEALSAGGGGNPILACFWLAAAPQMQHPRLPPACGSPGECITFVVLPLTRLSLQEHSSWHSSISSSFCLLHKKDRSKGGNVLIIWAPGGQAHQRTPSRSGKRSPAYIILQHIAKQLRDQHLFPWRCYFIAVLQAEQRSASGRNEMLGCAENDKLE